MRNVSENSYSVAFYGWSAAYSSSTNWIMYAFKHQKVCRYTLLRFLVEQAKLTVVYAILLALNASPASKCQHKF